MTRSQGRALVVVFARGVLDLQTQVTEEAVRSKALVGQACLSLASYSHCSQQ